MGDGLSHGPTSPVIASFQHDLVIVSFIVLVALVLLAVGWHLLDSYQEQHRENEPEPKTVDRVSEAPARFILRIGFALLWLFDGILQTQASMPQQLASSGFAATTAGSPAWLVHLVHFGIALWNHHQVLAAVASVWVQVGIGFLLLLAPRGRFSQLAGAISLAWAIVVFIFGESAGGIFMPDPSFLTGVPAAGIYIVASILLMLPEKGWSTPQRGRRLLFGYGLFLFGMAALQAWPGRGYYGGSDNTLSVSDVQMAQMRQPHFLSAWLRDVAHFLVSYGAPFNVAVVVLLAVVGICFMTGRRRLVLPALAAYVAFCLFDWVFIEDFGFLGGLGTDPSSMIPFIIVAWACYVAICELPETVPVEVRSAPPGNLLQRLEPGVTLRLSLMTIAFGLTIYSGAILVVALSEGPH